MVYAAKIRISAETAKGAPSADEADGFCLLADGSKGLNCGKKIEGGPLEASFFGFQRFTGIRIVFRGLMAEKSRPILVRSKWL